MASNPIFTVPGFGGGGTATIGDPTKAVKAPSSTFWSGYKENPGAFAQSQFNTSAQLPNKAPAPVGNALTSTTHQAIANAPKPTAAQFAPKPGFLTRNLQTIGGIGGGLVGGVLGGPAGAVIGAGLGAGLGEEGKRAGEGVGVATNNQSDAANVGHTLLNNLKPSLVQGGEAAATQLVGEKVAAPLVGKLGGLLSKSSEAVDKAASFPVKNFIQEAATSNKSLSGLTADESRQIIRNLPEDTKLFSQLGIKNAQDLANAHDLATGATGHLASLNRTLLQNANPVSMSDAEKTIGEALTKITDPNAKATAQNLIGQVSSKLIQAPEDSTKIQAQSVLDAMQHIDGLKQGMSGEGAQGEVKGLLNTLKGALNKTLSGNAGADAAAKAFKYDAGTAQDIMAEAKQLGIPKVGQYIIDSANSADSIAANRAAQAPLVRGGNAVEAGINSGVGQKGILSTVSHTGSPRVAGFLPIRAAITKGVPALADNGIARGVGSILSPIGGVLSRVGPAVAPTALQADKGNLASQGSGALSGLSGLASHLPFVGKGLSGLLQGAANELPRSGMDTSGLKQTNFNQPSSAISDFAKNTQGAKLSAGASGVLSNYQDTLNELSALSNVLGSGGNFGQYNTAITSSIPSIAKALGMSVNKANTTTITHLLPSATDSPIAAQQKMMRLKQMIDSHTEQNLGTEISKMNGDSMLGNFIGAQQ